MATDTVHLRAQHHIVAGLGPRWVEGERPVAGPRDVHEEIERARRSRLFETELRHGGGQVVGAVVVIDRAAELFVALLVAGGEQRVVDALGRILHQGQHGLAPGRVERIAGARDQLQENAAGVLHGHALGEVVRAEGPGVDHLFAMGVDDLNRLSLGQMRRLAAACRYGLKRAPWLTVLPLKAAIAPDRWNFSAGEGGVQQTHSRGHCGSRRRVRGPALVHAYGHGGNRRPAGRRRLPSGPDG